VRALFHAVVPVRRKWEDDFLNEAFSNENRVSYQKAQFARENSARGVSGMLSVLGIIWNLGTVEMSVRLLTWDYWNREWLRSGCASAVRMFFSPRPWCCRPVSRRVLVPWNCLSKDRESFKHHAWSLKETAPEISITDRLNAFRVACRRCFHERKDVWGLW